MHGNNIKEVSLLRHTKGRTWVLVPPACVLTPNVVHDKLRVVVRRLQVRQRQQLFRVDHRVDNLILSLTLHITLTKTYKLYLVLSFFHTMIYTVEEE